ncbi:condensation domain-containing protein [Massilia sp. GER05]|uniref:condensation domain-containing protein n=1 Tax=Massilia sp. GER05 TaxID=3394605 RepID=UPI003F83C32C
MEVLLWRDEPQSGSRDKTAFSFLQDGSNVSDAITFAELTRRAKSVAAHLMQCTQQGDRVILLYPPSLEFIVGFFGCIISGRIAVPAIAPSSSRHMERLLAIVDDSGAQVVLTMPAITQRIGSTGQFAQMARLNYLASSTLPDLSTQWHKPAIASNDIAFLQYTSGSTGTPKGVMVSHANLRANLLGGHNLLQTSEDDVAVTWLPAYHDFGLIAGIIGTVAAGNHCVQIPPAAFLMNPFLWLKAIMRYRARLTGAPNFAYEMCIRRVSEEQKAELDLSTLEIALNGAEPIRPSTLRGFVQAFAGCNFNPRAITPAYGLAESTLLVSMNRDRRQADGMPTEERIAKTALAAGVAARQETEQDAIAFVNHGSALPEHEIIIVANSDGKFQATGEIGEIWVHGPSVCAGYWNRPDLNAILFSGRVEGLPGHYLRTGDLGFLRDGDLFVTGRVKELMIFDARNIYPQDVEKTLEQLDPAFRPLSAAAFSIERGGEDELILVQELELQVRADVSGLVARVRAEIAEQHGILRLGAIVLVKAGSLPRTTSGKIQRVLCREMFLEDKLIPVWAWRNSDQLSSVKANEGGAPSPTAQALLKIWECCTGTAAPGVDDDFLSVGGHSLLAVQLMARIQSHFEVDLPLQVMFEASTIRSLAERIDLAPRLNSGICAPIPRVERNRYLPLSHAQQRLWFIDQLEGGGHSTYVIPLALRLRGELRTDAMQEALNGMIARHETLRTVFDTVDGKPVQIIAPKLALPLPITDLQSCPDADAELQRLLRIEANCGFDLRCGPLLRARLIRLADTDHVFTLTIHHISADGWSIGVMLRELGERYAAILNGRSPLLPPLSIQYADFASWQTDARDEVAAGNDLNWWLEQLENVSSLDLPTDFRRPVISSGRGGLVARMLPSPERVDDFARKSGTTRFPVLLAAFLTLMQRYSGQDDFCIGTPVANRVRAEMEPLIGFFANTVVLRACLTGDPTFEDLAHRVRKIAQEALVHQNVPFEKVVDALGAARESGRTPVFQVMFVLQNSLGEMTSLPGLDCEPMLVDSGAAKFDLTLSVIPNRGRMHVVFEYNADIFASDSIERMADRYLRLVDALLTQPKAAISAVSIHEEENA